MAEQEDDPLQTKTVLESATLSKAAPWHRCACEPVLLFQMRDAQSAQ
jgi:hypothetical protein